MNRFSRYALAVGLIFTVPTGFAEVGTFPVQQGFLSLDYALLETAHEEEGGVDLIYAPEGTWGKLGKYEGVIVDQPEVWIDEASEYGGAKPENLVAVAELIREGLSARLVGGGYNVVDAPGPNIVYLRIALTDLYLKKKKRKLLAYTPIGAVAKAGADIVREMMDKVDIIEMALQLELVDSDTDEVLGAAIIKRGARKDKATGQKLVRIDFDEFREIVAEYGARIRCRFDNADLPESQWIDCTDPAARAEREAA
jgi:hypothetical protein